MKINNILICSVFAILCTWASAVEPMTSADLSRLCRDQLAGPEDTAEGSCTAYIRGFLAGLPEVRIGTGPESQPYSNFVQRALQTRVGNRLREQSSPNFCIPRDTTSEDVARRILNTAADSNQQVAAEQLMLSVLRQHYPCATG